MDWQSKEAKQRINTSYSQPDRTRKEIRRCHGGRASEKKEAGTRERDERNSGSGFGGKPRLYRDPGLFEARRRSSSQPTVCTVKVARIDRTAGLSSTSIDDDYFRHRISGLCTGENI